MLEYRVRVPTRDRHGDLLSAELRGLWENNTIALFCTLFGGCEVSSTQRNWIEKRCDGTKRFHQERIKTISGIGPSEEGYGDVYAFRLFLETLKEHCQDMAVALNQKCVMPTTVTECAAEFIGEQALSTALRR